MSSTERALHAVRVTAAARRDEALRRWQVSGTGAATSDPSVLRALTTVGRLTVNFHPDRVARSGLTVADGMARTGRYVSQWVTGISNGGRSAFAGGDRQRWEQTLFAHAYADADPSNVEFPNYGAWDLLGDPHGGSPGSGHASSSLPITFASAPRSVSATAMPGPPTSEPSTHRGAFLPHSPNRSTKAHFSALRSINAA